LVTGTGTCDLCGLSADGRPVVQAFEGEEKVFCCQGCARVYQLALQNDMLDAVLGQQRPGRAGLKQAVLDPGQTLRFSLEGMWCAGCATAAEHLLRHHPGVKSADVSFAAERGRLQYDPARVDPLALLQELDVLGYRARLLTDAGQQVGERQQERMLLQLVVAAAFGMQVMILYLVQLYPLYAAGQFDSSAARRMAYLVWALSTPVVAWGGSSFLRGAWRALRARTATMDTLVTLGTLSAYGYSVYITLTGSGEAYFDSVAMITTFVMVGRYLEALGSAQARKDIRHLLQLQPDRAHKRMGETWQEVPARELEIGDWILVKPGERVPADAEIVEGEGAVDEALLTGESMPVDKAVGDTVFAGTVVADAALICQVTRPVHETRLAQIARLVEETLSAKPPIQRLVDRAAAYFAFGILGVSLLAALSRALAGHSFAEAVLAAVAVLVVACPCALGLATPLALTVALGRATAVGILVRNPAALETAARVRRIVLDKTGTLTMGRMSVTAVMAATGAGDKRNVLCSAAAVEQYSAHPIALAIGATCSDPLPTSDAFRSVRGYGASAQVGERRVMVGSSRFLGVDDSSPLIQEAQVCAEKGATVVWVGWSGQISGFIALRDLPNPTAKAALDQLEAAGLHTVMLSGDDPRTTWAISEELGIAEHEGDCPPLEKAVRIQGWQEGGERVAMVGDGVNDAPALAQADLSITAAGGTDVAGETSDVVLTHADLTLVPWLIRLSRRTRRIIVQNLGWAFAYNLFSVPLAALGVISPVIAAVTMSISSLLVVGNSLRLRR
jgi:heavy metal translocating P-type ATPase